MPERPYQVEGFVGQRKIIEPVLRQQDGATSRGEPLAHTLCTGPSGTGKSLLARTLAKRSGTDMIKFVGDVSIAEALEGFTEVDSCDFVFFDEAHNLSSQVQEFLFDVIDTANVAAKYVQQAKSAKVQKPYKVPPFTLIFATDRPGKLLDALHKRIPNKVHFGRYSKEEMKEIVELAASHHSMLLSPQAARRVADVCNGLPRRAEHYVCQIRYHIADAEQRQLKAADINDFLASWGVNEDGLGKQERQYVRFLASNKSASLETLASVLGCDPDFVRSQIEQPLRYRGLIRIESRGRVLTCDGVKLVEKWRDASEAQKREE